MIATVASRLALVTGWRPVLARYTKTVRGSVLATSDTIGGCLVVPQPTSIKQAIVEHQKTKPLRQSDRGGTLDARANDERTL
jgi:hypothetical protein